jgi:uncharacterized protein (DUF2147 family)
MLRPLALLLLASTNVYAASTFLGDWKTPANSIVRVEQCGAAVCLRVVRLSPAAPSSTDQQNPDAALHSRRLCGLVVGTGFHPDDAAHLSDGRLYDPKSGHTYRGTITADGDTLHLRGYIGIPLFGRSETWQRTAPISACKS